MSARRSLRIYLDDIPRRRAEKGNFNIINLIRAAFEDRGFGVELCRNSTEARLHSAADPGYSLFHMDDPFHPRALTLRRAYYYPFWRIEASAKRWEWQVAKAQFEPETIDAAEAERFCSYWRKRLFGLETPPDAAGDAIYVPLQGRLLDARSFQTCSPVDMLRKLAETDAKRPILVSFHPGEIYTPAEREAVLALADALPRLSIATDPMETLLSRCAYVATENSSVALAGYFFHRPAVLFAQIDFHHIAASVAGQGVEGAVARVLGPAPDYDRYLYLFLQLTAINGGAPDAKDRIIETVRRHGWEL